MLLLKSCIIFTCTTLC